MDARSLVSSSGGGRASPLGARLLVMFCSSHCLAGRSSSSVCCLRSVFASSFLQPGEPSGYRVSFGLRARSFLQFEERRPYRIPFGP